jgi:trimethylamine---corrinoid protein Co-methyltransferase
MYDRLQTLTTEQLEQIHAASMNILQTTGVKFNLPEALALFRRHGFNVTDDIVRFTEAEVLRAVESAPSRFVVSARNPAHDAAIGGDDFVLLPTGGAPQIAGSDGGQRMATLEDLKTCCKLVQTSPVLGMGGIGSVQPGDIPAETSHLDTLLATIVMSDKPFVSSSSSGTTARNSFDMAAICWGGRHNIVDKVVTGVIINPLSPLQYAPEQALGLMEMARHGQFTAITNMVMAGSSGPLSLPGLLALENAEILAGLVLTQLAGPGAPVIYGTVSCTMDMRTGIGSVGSPETVIIASATTQLARYYNLPCRTGGISTDAHLPDAQAMAEGALLLSTAVRNGANFIPHSCGQMGSFISLSFEKWLMDEEFCAMLCRVLKPLEITAETLEVETINAVGAGGEYLTHPGTYAHFRDLYQPALHNRLDHQQWLQQGARDLSRIAAEALPRRLAQYEKPPIDAGLEEELVEFVRRKKKDYV